MPFSEFMMYIDIDNLKGVKKPLEPEVSRRDSIVWQFLFVSALLPKKNKFSLAEWVEKNSQNMFSSHYLIKTCHFLLPGPRGFSKNNSKVSSWNRLHIWLHDQRQGNSIERFKYVMLYYVVTTQLAHDVRTTLLQRYFNV